MEGIGLTAGGCRYNPSGGFHYRTVLLSRSRNARIIRAVAPWRSDSQEPRKSVGGGKTIFLGATNKHPPGSSAPGGAFSRYLHAVIQKDYAVGYLCLAMLSKGTTTLWAMLEVLSHVQATNAQAPQETSGSSSGPMLARALEELSAPRHFVNQIGASVVVPSADELVDLLGLPPPHTPNATTSTSGTKTAADVQDEAHGDLPAPRYRPPPPIPGLSDHGGSSTLGSAVRPYLDGSGAGGIGNGGSGGGGGGGDDGDLDGQDQPPESRRSRPSFWLAVAMSIALVIPPSVLVELLVHLGSPLLQPPAERQPRPRMARRVTPRKRRFVLLQHGTTRALDGSSVLLLSPRSVAATLLFPATAIGSGPVINADELQRATSAASAVPGVSDLLSLPLSAQLTGLANALTAAYDRETRLAARLITRRAVSYVINDEKIGGLTAALDESSRTLSLSQRRMEAISRSMETLQQELEHDVSLLCEQLEDVSEHRDALLDELEASHNEVAAAVADGHNLASQLRRVEAERRELQEELAEVRTRLDESDAYVRLAARERDQERRRGNTLTTQLKHAVRFVSALEGTMSALPDLQVLVDDTGSPSDALDTPSSSSERAPLPTPMRAVLSSAQQRASELAQLQEESSVLQEQLRAQAAARAADAAALARAEQQVADLRADMLRLEVQLVQAGEARQALEADLAAAQRILGDLQDSLRTSVEQLAEARRAQADVELQLQDVRGQLQGALEAAAGSDDARRAVADQLAVASSQLDAASVERAALSQQLQHSHQELATARAHLLHAQHHVVEALAEKGTLRAQLATARQQLQAAEAEVAVQVDRCCAAEDASAALAVQLADAQVKVAALASKLQSAQSDAGSALAAKAALEAHVAQLVRAQQYAASCAATASEELKMEVAELRARFGEAQVARQLAEQEALDLRDRADALEEQLTQAQNDRASEADAGEQHVAHLRRKLAANTAALLEAQAAASVACESEASKAAAVEAADAIVAGLKGTIEQLRQSLAAADQELQQYRDESAAAAAASEARAAALLRELHQRDAAAAGLQVDLAEVTAQLDRERAAALTDAADKAQLQAQLTARLLDMQCKMELAEAASTEASGLQHARAAELQQRCEEGCRSVADLHTRLVVSEASRQELLSQVEEAELERARLLSCITEAKAEQSKLQEALHASGKDRQSLEAQVAVGDSARCELQARLHSAEEVLSEALSQLSDANSALRLLHQRLLNTDAERLELKTQLASTTQERQDIRALLAAQLQELQHKLDLVEEASAEASSVYSSRTAELQLRCAEGVGSVLELQTKLAASEASRQELLSQAAAAEEERQRLVAQVEGAQAEQARLLTEVKEAEMEQRDLQEMLDATVEERESREAEVAEGEALRSELQARLKSAEAARAEARAQLSFTSSALQLLQQHLDSADAERLDLRAQLATTVEERRELRTQLAVRVLELQRKMDMVETSSTETSNVLAARAAELQQRCEEGGRSVVELQTQLAASEASRQQLLAEAAQAEAERLRLLAQVEEAEVQQHKLLSKALDAEAEQQKLHGMLDAAGAEHQAAEGELQARLQCSEAARVEAQTQLVDANAMLLLLQQRLEGADMERLSFQIELAVSAEERQDLQEQLSTHLLELQSKMDLVEATAVQVDALHATRLTELQRRCDEEGESVRALQAQLGASEASRRELVDRIAEADAERQGLLSQVAMAETERHKWYMQVFEAEAKQDDLSDMLAAASIARQHLEAQIASGEATRQDLQERLRAAETAHGEALEQLSDSNLALQLLQQSIDDTDDERLDLQNQLATMAAGYREVQVQLAARLLELQRKMDLVEEAAVQVDALHAARTVELQRRCDQGDRSVLDLQTQLAASEASQQALLSQVSQAEAEQRQLQDVVDAFGAARQTLVAQVAGGEAARSELAARVQKAEAARDAALAQLLETNSALRVLQQRLAAAGSERGELQTQLASVTMSREELRMQLAFVRAAHEQDRERLAAADYDREQLCLQLTAADAMLLEMHERVETAEASNAEVQYLTSSSASAQLNIEVQLAAALKTRQHLRERLAAMEADRNDVQARLETADSARDELQAQLAVSASALQALQEQLEGWEAACGQAQAQLARTDAMARELMSQVAMSEAQRHEVQERLGSVEAAYTSLHAQLVNAQLDRDGLTTQLAEAEVARKVLQKQVTKFQTQLSAATDAQVIRRMTNTTAIQEQYERLSMEVTCERVEARARQEQMLLDMASLQAAADQQTVRSIVRVAVARACWRAAEEERRAFQEELQRLTWGFGNDLDREEGLAGTQTADVLRMSPERTGAADASAGNARRRGSSRVLSLGGFLQDAAVETVDNRSRLLSYQQQLEHVRQRLIEMRPQTASRMAAVDAALEVPSSFASMVQLAVSRASPLAAGVQPLLLTLGEQEVQHRDQLRDQLRDSFSMVPDLSSLGNMLDANSSAQCSSGGAPMPAPRAPSMRQEVSEARCTPVVPFSTPVTEYRHSGMSRGSRYATPTGAFSPHLPLPSTPIGEQLAVLQDQLIMVEETGRLLGARLDAACVTPTAGILETVAAQIQAQGPEALFRPALERPLMASGVGGNGTQYDSCLDPLQQIDSDHASTLLDVHAVASSLLALRSGIQIVLAQQQQPNGVAMSGLLAHVQLLEDQLLGGAALLPHPTPAGMLLPLPRSPGQARYAPAAGKLGAAGGDGTNATGGGVCTDGGSTPLEIPSPQHSEPATTPSDSPLLMATDSPAPPFNAAKHHQHQFLHSHQHAHPHLNQHPHQNQHQHQHLIDSANRHQAAVVKGSPQLSPSDGLGRRVAAITALAYEDPVAATQSPSLQALMPRAQPLASMWDKNTVALWGNAGQRQGQQQSGAAAASMTSLEGHGHHSEEHYGQQEWRSATDSPESVADGTVLTATPPLLSPAHYEPASEVTVAGTPQNQTLRITGRRMDLIANQPIIAGPASGESSATSDEVCVATPLAFNVPNAPVPATPCLTPQPLDANAAEQLLRYTNPCFARTPSVSELGAAEQGGDVGAGRRGHERPSFGGQVPAMSYLGDGLPALEVSESVDISVLRTAHRRACFSAGSIEEGPMASAVQVTRGGGHSMPFLAAAPPNVSNEEGRPPVLGNAPSLVTCSSGGGAEPTANFQPSNAESLSLYGSVTKNAAYSSHVPDPLASDAALRCLPPATRSRKFSFRLPSRQGSRTSMINPNESQGGAAEDNVSVASSQYRGNDFQSLDLSSSGAAPLPPLGAKRKKGGFLGKIKRAMGVGRSVLPAAASATALPPRPT